MTTDMARIAREIALERAALLGNLAALEDRARALADWRQPIRRRPFEAVGMALAGGVVLGLMGRRREAAPREAGEDGAPSAPAARRSHPVMVRFAEVFAAVAAEAAFDAIARLLPRTKDEAQAPRRAAAQDAAQDAAPDATQDAA